jgi:aminopeptidase N
VTPLFRTSAEIEIALPGETLVKKIQITKAEETYHFQVAERPTRVCFDPKDWLLKKLTFSKSKEELLDQLANDKNVICRLQAIQGLDSQKGDPQVAAALMTAAAKDAFWGIREEAVKVVGKLNGDEARKSLITAAKDDKKSFVRRAAVSALGSFADDESRAALLEVFHKDGSYYAAAEALRSLLKIDRDNVRDLLITALDRPSHHEVLLRAACDGLAELKDAAAGEKIAATLKSPLSPERRIVLLGALARLQGGDAVVVKQVEEQLHNDRVDVRRAAVESLVALAQPAAIPALQARREKEQHRRTLREIDEAIAKLRDKNKSAEDLRKEVEALRKKNEDLESRLKKLEGKAKE